jgi:hypothetical protein
MMNTGRAAAAKLLHARILRKADAGDRRCCWTDAAMAEALDPSASPVQRVRQACVAQGREAAVARQRPMGRQDRTRDGRQEAHAECVCAMEDVLEVTTRPDDPRRPQVCVDDTSTPWVAETRAPLPATPGQPERVDDEQERQGTAHLLMVFEPLAGQRRVQVTARRTAVDCAHLLREVCDEHDPQVEKMVLVMDNLNTHTLASLSEACAPAEARRLAERCEIHDTPKHGSWLHMAETEQQC